MGSTRDRRGCGEMGEWLRCLPHVRDGVTGGSGLSAKGKLVLPGAIDVTPTSTIPFHLARISRMERPPPQAA